MKSLYAFFPLLAAVALLVSPFILYYGDTILVVTSDSMAPTLKPYDLIAAHSTAITDVHVGDIIVFNADLDGLSTVVHRVNQIFDDNGRVGITTKGDNSSLSDPWIVHEGDIVGKVVSSVPNLGFFLFDRVRYALSALVIVASVSLIWEFKGKAEPSRS